MLRHKALSFLLHPPLIIPCTFTQPAPSQTRPWGGFLLLQTAGSVSCSHCQQNSNVQLGSDSEMWFPFSHCLLCLVSFPCPNALQRGALNLNQTLMLLCSWPTFHQPYISLVSSLAYVSYVNRMDILGNSMVQSVCHNVDKPWLWAGLAFSAFVLLTHSRRQEDLSWVQISLFWFNHTLDGRGKIQNKLQCILEWHHFPRNSTFNGQWTGQEQDRLLPSRATQTLMGTWSDTFAHSHTHFVMSGSTFLRIPG